MPFFKKNVFFAFLLVVVAIIMAALYVTHKPKQKPWYIYMPGVGTGSSPRTTDLNQDGVLDIVIGAGSAENQQSNTAVIALNGVNGSVLWRVRARNQIVGSAIFKDITKDGIDDVFIGGRSAELLATNGVNGGVLWKFFPQRNNSNPADSGLFIFASAQFIPDQDNDGLHDLLVANGETIWLKHMNRKAE